MKIKQKKCRVCKEPFTPQRPLQVVCHFGCAIILAKETEAKKDRKETAVAKEKALTHKDWLNLLQIVFNAFIRQRDELLPCITCGTTKPIQYHAGHFYSVGGNPGLRFNEDNCHKQCSACNCHKHGNLIIYSEQLPLRIGQQRFDALKVAKNTESKLSIPEIKEKITHYRSLTKTLKLNT